MNIYNKEMYPIFNEHLGHIIDCWEESFTPLLADQSGYSKNKKINGINIVCSDCQELLIHFKRKPNSKRVDESHYSNKRICYKCKKFDNHLLNSIGKPFCVKCSYKLIKEQIFFSRKAIDDDLRNSR